MAEVMRTDAAEPDGGTGVVPPRLGEVGPAEGDA
jgi:hypothetical protein